MGTFFYTGHPVLVESLNPNYDPKSCISILNLLLGAMTTLLHPEHGRCGVDLHDRDEEVGDGCTTNS